MRQCGGFLFPTHTMKHDPIIPAIIKSAERTDAQIVAHCKESIIKADRSSWDVADDYRVLSERGWTKTKIAEEFGVHRSSVSRFVACTHKCALGHARPPFWEVYRDIKGGKADDKEGPKEVPEPERELDSDEDSPIDDEQAQGPQPRPRQAPQPDADDVQPDMILQDRPGGEYDPTLETKEYTAKLKSVQPALNKVRQLSGMLTMAADKRTTAGKMVRELLTRQEALSIKESAERVIQALQEMVPALNDLLPQLK